MITISDMDDQEVLARTAWGECRGGGSIGMQSVINVICNRAASPKWWGHDIRSVCLKAAQFSCWLPSDPNRNKLMSVDESDAAYNSALNLAQQAIEGTLPDITNGATYYYSIKGVARTPNWAIGKIPCATIKGQYFFNNID